jgi:hypothetical protein
MAAHQRIDADCQHRAHDVDIQRLADTDCVRDDKVVLQLFQQRALVWLRLVTGQFVACAMRAEQLVGIAAETRRHAVNRLAALDLLGEEVRRTLHFRQLRHVERHARAACDRDDMIADQTVAIEDDWGSHAGITCACSSSTRSVFTSSARGTSN